MIAIPLVLTFLKNNWKLLVVGLAIATLLGYIGFLKTSKDYYKNKAQELQLIINQAGEREEQLKLGNAAITAEYEKVLLRMNQQTEKVAALTKEKIKNDKELNSLRVSLNAVRLFNESKRDPTAPPSDTKQGDEGSAQGTAAGISLAVIWTQVAENDANHWKCVKQVVTWQKFWEDYEANYNGVTSDVSP